MTPRSSDATAVTQPPPPSLSARASGRQWTKLLLRWQVLLCAVLVVAAIVVALAVAYDNGAFARGPAVDAATAYVADIQRHQYAAAYALLAPDLRHTESEQSFAARMGAIETIDGRITAVSAVSQQQSGATTVVQLSITRARRGTFTAHLAVVRSGGAWLIIGADDL